MKQKWNIVAYTKMRIQKLAWHIYYVTAGFVNMLHKRLTRKIGALNALLIGENTKPAGLR